MKVSNADSKRMYLLGAAKASQKSELDAAAVRSWRKSIGYLSLFAGAATILASQAQNVSARESDKPAPPRVRKAASDLLKRLNGGGCSKPGLLRRQTEYRLPGEAGKFNMVEILAGGDDCPGQPIPAGTYTVASPYVDSGTTTGANKTVSTIPLACNGIYDAVGGEDHIYSFTLTARGATPQIRVTTSSPTYDLSIYVLNGNTGEMCPSGTGNTVTNCIVGADGTFFPNPETLTPANMATLPLNVPLYLFVDSFYGAPGGNGGTGNGPYTVTMQDVTIGGGPVLPENDAPMDLNADGKTDFVTLRNVGGGTSGQVRWYPFLQDYGPVTPRDWGIATDQFFAADYDLDGRDDYAVYRPGAQGTFYIVRSQSNTISVESFGGPSDDATIVGDYTGDGRADLALYRGGATPADPSFWYYRSVGGDGGFTTVPWGQGGDTPAPGDYDGDGKFDFVVQRDDANGVNGRFWKRMNSGAQSSEMFGLKTDTVVPGDYDDDGKTDLAVIRDDAGFMRWDFEPSGTAGSTVVSDTWGVTATDWITAGDYDGDGRTDYAVWRPGSPGRFWIMTVSDRVIFWRDWGEATDAPALYYSSF